MSSTRLPLKRVFGLSILLSALLLTSCSITDINTIKPTATYGPPKSFQIPPIEFTSASWETIAFPGSGIGTYAYAVTPNDPTVLYACTSDPASSAQILFWSTHDTGQHWSRLAFPNVNGDGCTITVDPQNGQTIAVQIRTTNQSNANGQSYYGLSIDGGTSWKYLVYTPEIPAKNMSYRFSQIVLDHAHIYIYTSF